MSTRHNAWCQRPIDMDGDLKQFGERHDNPLVRLPGGYNPNQVAVQVVAQCSGQLGGE